MTFEQLREYFAKAEASAKLSHSYLVVGKKIDKEAILQIAKNLLNSTFEGNSPDLVVNDSSETVSIEEIRDLQKILSLKPHSAVRKIMVIFEAQRLSLDAANAFLKTLEEPPDHSLIILTSSQPRALLPTILSRCLMLRASSLAKDDFSQGQQSFDKALSLPLKDKFAWSEKLNKDQDGTKKLLEEWVRILPAEKIALTKKRKILYYIDRVLRAQNKGINSRQALDLLLMNI